MIFKVKTRVAHTHSSQSIDDTKGITHLPRSLNHFIIDTGIIRGLARIFKIRVQEGGGLRGLTEIQNGGSAWTPVQSVISWGLKPPASAHTWVL